MSPAFEAAMHTTVPTVRIAARAEGSVQPQRTKTRATPSRVTRVMPEVGLDDTPIRPTMRDETTTKRAPKLPPPGAAGGRGGNGMPPAGRPEIKTGPRTTPAGPART